MNKLIKFETKILFKQKFYLVCLLLSLLLEPIFDFCTNINSSNFETIKVMPKIMSNLSSAVSLIDIILIVLFCCLDFSEGTLKNVISRGYSKVQVLFSKYISCFIGVFSMYLVIFVVTCILFGVNGFEFESSMVYLFIESVIKMIAYVVFFSTISFVLEKTSFAIIACLFIQNIINLALTFVDSKLGLDISKFWIDNIGSNFLNNITTSNMFYTIFGYVVYTIIFIFIGITCVKRKEVK